MNDWTRTAQEVRDTSRDYPRSILTIIGRVRVPYLRELHVEHVEEELSQRAKRDGRLVWLRRGDRPPTRIVHAVDRRRLLQELGADDAFLATLRARVRSTLRERNALRWRTAGNDLPGTIAPTPVLAGGGTVTFDADIGFNTAGYLGALPEGLAVALARRVLSRVTRSRAEEGLGAGELVPVSVLVLGADASPIGLAFETLSPDDVDVTIVEVDQVGIDPVVALDRPRCVRQRVGSLADLRAGQRFDVVVVHAPAPALGIAAQYRNVAKTQNERRLFDPGRLGPRKWRLWIKRLVTALPAVMAENSEAIVVLPEGLRRFAGYDHSPELLAEVPGWFTEAGLRVDLACEIREENPRPQPFVGRNRCLLRCWVVRPV